MGTTVSLSGSGPMSMPEKRKTWGRRLLLIAAAALLGLNLYRWNAGSILGNRMPMPFGVGLSTVLTGSMEPTLHVNDLVIVRKTQDVQVGDIIIYQSGDDLVIHRVVEMEDDSLVTKGDANNAADDSIHRSDVKGVMTARIGGVGAVVQVLKHPAAVAAVLICAVLLTELSYRREKKKNEEELTQLEDEIQQLMAEIKRENRD